MSAMAPVPLGVCAIFRGETPYLREWIEFHHLVGVDRFFLYDNEPQPSDEAWEVLRPYYHAGLVHVVRWPGERAQLDAYHHALSAWGRMVRWMAFLDIDEFLFSPTGQPLPDVLKWFCGVAQVGACWAVYGTSGHARRPPGLVSESYLQRSADAQLSRHVKSIVRTARAIDQRPLDPHHFRVDGPSLDEQRRALNGPYAASPSYELLRVNHYISKSAEEARAKMARPRADNGELRAIDLLDPALNKHRDDAIMQWVPALKERL